MEVYILYDASIGIRIRSLVKVGTASRSNIMEGLLTNILADKLGVEVTNQTDLVPNQDIEMFQNEIFESKKTAKDNPPKKESDASGGTPA